MRGTAWVPLRGFSAMIEILGTVDLFGDPVPAGRGMPGRPEHVPTTENSNKIKILLAQGWTSERIANAIGVDAKTLRKHYSRLLKARDRSRDQVTARRLFALHAQAFEGNVAAIKELNRLEERDLLAALQAKFADADNSDEPDRRGKKEILAEQARAPQGEWADILPQQDMLQ
jgi:DNA-binding CsgD family transcriptional regulator